MDDISGSVVNAEEGMDSDESPEDTAVVAAGPFPSAGPLGVLQLNQANSILDVAWAPDGRHLVAFDAAGVATQWDATTQQGRTIRINNEGPESAGAPFEGQEGKHFRHVAFSADGKTLVVGTSWKAAVVSLPAGDVRLELGDAFEHGPLFVSPGLNYVVIATPQPAGDLCISLRSASNGAEVFRSPPIDRGYAYRGNYVAASPDGGILAIATGTGVRLFDTVTGKELTGIQRVNDVRDLAFSADGQQLVLTTDYDRQYWNVANPSRLNLAKKVLRDKDGLVEKLREYKDTAVSGDGRVVAAFAAYADVVEVLNIETGATVSVLNSGSDTETRSQISCVALDRTGRRAALGTVDGTILLRDINVVAERVPPLATFRLTRPENLDAHIPELKSPPDRIGFSADNKWLITGGKTTTVWDLQKQRQQIVLTINDGRDEWANVPKDYKPGMVWAGDFDFLNPLAPSGMVKAWEVPPGPALVHGWLLRSDGQALLTAERGRILEFGLFDGKHRGDFNNPGCAAMKMSPDGRFAAAWFVPIVGTFPQQHHDHTRTELVVLDAAGGKVRKSLGEFVQPDRLSHAGWGHHRTYFKLSFSADGKRLAADVRGKEEGDRIKIWNWESGEELPTTAESPVRDLEIVDAGKYLMTMSRSYGTESTMATFFEITSGTVHHELDLARGAGGELKAWAFAPVGKVFATGDQQGMVLIRDLETGEERARIAAHASPISAIEFSSDGEILASSAEDGAIQLWPLRDLVSASGRDTTSASRPATRTRRPVSY